MPSHRVAFQRLAQRDAEDWSQVLTCYNTQRVGCGIPYSQAIARSQGGAHAVMLTFPLVKRELGEGVISDTPPTY